LVIIVLLFLAKTLLALLLMTTLIVLSAALLLTLLFAKAAGRVKFALLPTRALLLALPPSLSFTTAADTQSKGLVEAIRAVDIRSSMAPKPAQIAQLLTPSRSKFGALR